MESVSIAPSGIEIVESDAESVLLNLSINRTFGY
ncbi:hypothetical protein BN8_05932 [Fibrisoma limi BUZ 3]|uniref:Uncharacterized protein n=1 Tax=Fibrisoma limi BUZ 3 TaxID=1185876 RepID=I2GRP2_9BACT|nr:hypothetical protein BN8_05932 [Fibrisoma limi BUZ 3]